MFTSINSTPFQIRRELCAGADEPHGEPGEPEPEYEVKAEPINGHGLNGGDDALVGELVGGPSAHGSPKGKVKGKAKGEATEPEVRSRAVSWEEKIALPNRVGLARARPRRPTPL